MLSTGLFFLVGVQQAYCWGTLGHQTIAYIASNFVSADTESWAQDILGDTTTSYLANVATWADTYRYTSAGSFSAPFHYIDANDEIAGNCNVDYDRDCGDTGCSVSAIANYTARVQEPDSLSATEITTALKFLVHFLGDITQPLHDEALLVGGNSIDVTYDGTSTNLHHIWDTNMPEQLIGGYALSDAKSWAATLTTAIKTGTYKSKAASWIAGDDITDAIGSAMTWASDANAYVCTVVLPDGYTVLESGDLDGDYYDSAIGTIELQVAKAGYRLANWLDMLAATQSSKKRLGKKSIILDESELDGRHLLPAPRELTRAQLARRAYGWGCGHEH